MAKDLVEALEGRAHRGPPLHSGEIQSARDFLKDHDFSPSSEYFSRLAEIENRLGRRPLGRPAPAMKTNYGGDAAGYRMQVQCIYDHLILSTCYEGTFHTRRGRIKVSHRFNQAGRIDFVELKFLNSLHPLLNGELRKLLLVKGYDSLQRDWHSAEAFVLPALPQELVFLYEDIFRTDRADLFAWLVNIGHGLLDDMLKDLRSVRYHGGRNGSPRSSEISCGDAASSLGAPAAVVAENGVRRGPDQLALDAILDDATAVGIIEIAATLECRVEVVDPRHVVVRYLGR